MQPARDPDRDTLTVLPERAARVAGQTFTTARETPRCRNCGRPTDGDGTYCSRNCEEAVPGSYLG